MKFKLQFKPMRNPYLGKSAIQALHIFPNGYGVSVVRHRDSYGGDIGLFELAVLRNGQIDYSTPISCDVRGYLSRSEARKIAKRVRGFKKTKN